MKIILRILFFFFIITGTCNLFAQENYFTVLAAQGKISLLKNGKSNWIDIKTGDKINPGEKLKVGNNEYAGLVYSSGISIELKKEGVYDFDRLKNSIKNNYKSSNRKFTEYVINELTKKAKDSEDMKSMGAVVRKRTNYIEIGIPSPSLVIDSNIVFKWYPYSTSSNYIFKLLNNNDVTLFMKELTDTTLDCPIDLFHLNKGKNYKWIVFVYNNSGISSDTNYIMIPAAGKLEAIRDSINELNSIFGKDTTAITQIIYASFYQNNQLNIEALNAYGKALQLAPDVDVYKKMFANFLLKMKLTRMINYNGTGG
ncbi:MAG: hypothetical protein ABR980_11830 [Ignavibacteriaceae bacterium]|jgi:hypothetical protein